MRVTLANGTVGSLAPRMLETASITIEDGAIVRVASGLPEDAGTPLDCRGKLIIPGNVCAHTHLYSALARGMPAPPRTPRNFMEILELIWWRLDRALDQEGVRMSALVGLLDAVHSGTTTLFDHHSSPECIHGSLDIEASAFERVGVRGVLCYEVTDRNGPAGREAGLRENDRFLRKNLSGLVRGTIGAHASFTLEDGTLQALRALTDDHGTGVHIHTAEDIADQTDCMKLHRCRVVGRLDEAGILRQDSIMAHCVHVDEDESRELRASGAWVAHNCRSNSNNAVGRAPLTELGDRLALGTDGIDGDMFAESRTAYWTARAHNLDTGADDVARVQARGADLAASYFGTRIGALVPGARADLVMLDYDPPTPMTADNLAWHWMFGLSSRLVSDVMVDGRWVIRDRRCVTVDEERIRAEARREAGRIWAHMETI